jgi:HTH-type transcriptional regulator/antitoxin HigA
MPNTASKSSGNGAMNKGRMDRRYGALIRRFALRPLRTEADLNAAHEVLRELSLRDPQALSNGEMAYLDVLALVVRDYESARHPFASAKGPREILRFLMDESGMSVSDLGKVVGSQPEASMLLSGAREPSKEQVVRLAEHFRVRTELFLPKMPRRRKTA